MRAQVAEQPDVSFYRQLPCLAPGWTRTTTITKRIGRCATLKTTKLTPAFTVSRVILADGTEKTFE